MISVASTLADLIVLKTTFAKVNVIVIFVGSLIVEKLAACVLESTVIPSISDPSHPLIGVPVSIFVPFIIDFPVESLPFFVIVISVSFTVILSHLILPFLMLDLARFPTVTS